MYMLKKTTFAIFTKIVTGFTSLLPLKFSVIRKTLLQVTVFSFV